MSFLLISTIFIPETLVSLFISRPIIPYPLSLTIVFSLFLK